MNLDLWFCKVVFVLKKYFHFKQEKVYWIDMEHSAVYSANRLAGNDIAQLAADLDQPQDVVLYHNLKQPIGTETLLNLNYHKETAVFKPHNDF